MRRALPVFLVILFLVHCRAPVEPSPPYPSPRKVDGADPVKLVEMLKDPDDEKDIEKRYAATLLGIMRELSAIETLNGCLTKERSPAVREACTYALGEMGDETSLSILGNALADNDPAVRSAALDALTKFKSPESFSILKSVAEGNNGVMTLAALRAVAATDTQAARDFLAALKLRDPKDYTEIGERYETAKGKSWYVDASAGNDSAEGTEAAPFLTIGRAVKELRTGAGDAIYATSGAKQIPFRESLNLTTRVSGIRNAMTLLSAWPGKPAPIVDGSKPEAPDKPALEDGIHVGGSFIRIEGFVVRLFQDSGIDFDGAIGCIASNCRVEKCDRHGIFFYYSADCSVMNADVSGCNFQGISIRSSKRPVVLGGRSYNNGNVGLLFLWETTDAVVDGFTSTANQRGIYFLRGSLNGRIYRSTLTGNREVDFAVDPDSSAQVIDTRIGKAQ